MSREPKTTSSTLGSVDDLGLDLFDFVDLVGLFGGRVGPCVAVIVAMEGYIRVTPKVTVC